MNQKKYVINMLKIFNMIKCNTSKTPIDTIVKLSKEDKKNFSRLVGLWRTLNNLIYLLVRES